MKITDIIKRLLTYNFTFLFIYTNLLQADIQGTTVTKSNEFKKNVIFLFEKLKINNNALTSLQNMLNANPVLIFQITLGVLLFFSFLSIITQKKVFNFFFTILFGFIVTVFYNPFLPENKIAAPFGIRRELILSVGICIVMCVNIFNPESDSEKPVTKIEVHEGNIKNIPSEPRSNKKKVNKK